MVYIVFSKGSWSVEFASRYAAVNFVREEIHFLHISSRSQVVAFLDASWSRKVVMCLTSEAHEGKRSTSSMKKDRMKASSSYDNGWGVEHMVSAGTKLAAMG